MSRNAFQRIETELVRKLNLSVEEAATALGIGKRTLENMVRKGTAPPSFKIGSRRMFNVSKLERWCQEQAEGGHYVEA